MGNIQVTILLKTIYTRTYQHVTLWNHAGSSALERSVIDYGGRKHVLLDPTPRP